MGGDHARRRPAARPGPVARPSGDQPAGPASRVVRVVADVPALHRPFDYLVPAALAGAAEVGTEVRVVLHGRRVRAWVVAVDVVPPEGVALRPVAAVRGTGPPPAVVDLTEWAAWRWAGPRVAFLRTASSPTVVRGLPPAPVPTPVAPDRSGMPVVGDGTARRGAPGATGDAPPGRGDALAASAVAGGTAVVRVAPAADRRPVLRAALSRLGAPGVPGGAGVLVLVPEAADVPAAASELRAAGAPVAVLPQQWAAARAGGCAVVGTRAAAWAPLPALAAAVVLDAHDGAYVEQRAPTWSAWAVMAERARRDGAPCLLVTPCPTLELLAAGRLVAAPRRAERAGWPPVEVVDLRSTDPRHGLLTHRVAALGRWATATPGRRVVMVVNRTGGARLVVCAACGDVARCEHCGHALELVEEPAPALLRCRRCTGVRPVVCARCGSTATRALRPGVARLRRDLQALLGVPVAEVTAAGRRRPSGRPGAPGGGAAPPAPGAPGSTGPQPGSAQAPVVVGTDAALRGPGRVDAVVLLDVDGELLAPRLRASEDALALLARAARRLRGSSMGSRDRSAGRLVVQTRLPDHPVLRGAVAGDPSIVTEEEAPVRSALRLPPATAVALLGGPGAGELAAVVRGRGLQVEVDGPVDGTWTVRAADHEALSAALGGLPRPEARTRVDVDPADL